MKEQSVGVLLHVVGTISLFNIEMKLAPPCGTEIVSGVREIDIKTLISGFGVMT